MLSRLYYAGLSAVRLPAFSRRVTSGGLVVCDHNVVRGRDTQGGDPVTHFIIRPASREVRAAPPHEMHAALNNLERFLHDEHGFTPPVIKAGLAHAQFETVHPLLDGNGRLGRLLVSFMVVDGVLSQPVLILEPLYLSPYFKEHRADYYEALQRVRTHGDWEGWLRFYLIGVEAVANQVLRRRGEGGAGHLAHRQSGPRAVRGARHRDREHGAPARPPATSKKQLAILDRGPT